MIIGAIEQVEPNRVRGWIHCHAADLKGATALAFVDGRCVGSGEIGLFRQDLADAGLLQGELGFDFGITLADPEEAGRLVVSLERCEAVILQPGAQVLAPGATAPDVAAPAPVLAPAPPPAPPPPPALPSRATIDWLRDSGAATGAEADLLEALKDYGVAHWPPLREEDAVPVALEPLRPAARLFSLCALRMMEVGELVIDDVEALAAALSEPEGELAEVRLIAFHAARPLRLKVLERSHLAAADAGGDPLTHGMDYPVGPETLLFLHRDCRFAADDFGPNRRFRLYYPRPA